MSVPDISERTTKHSRQPSRELQEYESKRPDPLRSQSPLQSKLSLSTFEQRTHLVHKRSDSRSSDSSDMEKSIDLAELEALTKEVAGDCLGELDYKHGDPADGASRTTSLRHDSADTEPSGVASSDPKPKESLCKRVTTSLAIGTARFMHKHPSLSVAIVAASVALRYFGTDTGGSIMALGLGSLVGQLAHDHLFNVKSPQEPDKGEEKPEAAEAMPVRPVKEVESGPVTYGPVSEETVKNVPEARSKLDAPTPLKMQQNEQIAEAKEITSNYYRVDKGLLAVMNTVLQMFENADEPLREAMGALLMEDRMLKRPFDKIVQDNSKPTQDRHDLCIIVKILRKESELTPQDLVNLYSKLEKIKDSSLGADLHQEAVKRFLFLYQMRFCLGELCGNPLDPRIGSVPQHFERLVALKDDLLQKNVGTNRSQVGSFFQAVIESLKAENIISVQYYKNISEIEPPQEQDKPHFYVTSFALDGSNTADVQPESKGAILQALVHFTPAGKDARVCVPQKNLLGKVRYKIVDPTEKNPKTFNIEDFAKTPDTALLAVSKAK